MFYAGAIGAGSVCKLVHNMIGHGVRQAIAEGLTLGVKAGVDAETLWECVRRGSTGRLRYLHESVPRNVFRKDYDNPSFMLALARKDIALANELGREFQVPMPIANLAEQIAIQGSIAAGASKTAVSPSCSRKKPLAWRCVRPTSIMSKPGSLSPPTLMPNDANSRGGTCCLCSPAPWRSSTRDVTGNIVLKIFDHRQNRIRRGLPQTANGRQCHGLR